MPYRRRYRRYRRRNGGFSRKGMGFPRTRRVVMRYVTGYTYTFNVAGVAETIFSANSIFDPDRTSTGHQPYGHDQWSTFYGQYLVLGSKINVSFTQKQSATGEPLICGVELASDSSASALGVLVRAERSNVNYTQAPGFGATNSKHVSKTFSARKWFNRGDPLDMWDDLGADFGSNPIEEAFFRVWVGDDANLTQGNAVEAIITIEYLVVLGEPHVLAQS